jgi:fibronectin type 3 domain-containing protein
MRRIFLVVCMIVSAGACVKLSKPKQVAECAASKDGCINTYPDAGDTANNRDLGASPAIDGPVGKTDADAPGRDVKPGTDDIASILPDVARDTRVVPDDGPAVTPDDVPVVSPDGPIVDPDGPVVVTDTPITTPDGPGDLLPDTRDAYRDVAAGFCGTGSGLKPAGTLCREAVDLCDVPETCDGVSADCPADTFASAGKECRASAGDCDIAETCSGTSVSCPADGFKQAGTVCRAVAGPCDMAESCTGGSANCPNDSLKQSSSVCREATSVCDPAENCTGLGASCPQDVPAYTQPTAPATVTATPGELQATLTWSAATAATGYNIRRSTTAGGPYTTIATAVLSSPFVDTGLDSTKTYYYVLTSINTIASCESTTGSTEVLVKPTGICSKPSAPTVTPTAGNGQVTLNWGAITGATAYTVDRSETSGTGYASLASVTAPTTTYVDKAVTFGKTYYYRVTTKAACDSDPSIEVSAAPLCTPAATVPTGLSATTPNTGGVVVLTWNAVSGAKTTDRYYVMRKLSSGSTYTKIDEVLPPAITYSDTTAANGTPYDYAVTYYNGTCTSGNSNLVTATAACVMDKPVLSATAGNKKVDLSWTPPANGSPTGYKLYRKDTGSYSVIATLTGAGITTYSNTGLTNGTTYTYYVTALGNCTADSDPKPATPVCTPLSKPTNLVATPGNAQVTLNWDAAAGADHYTVKRGEVDGGPYTALTPALPITTNSYTDTGLVNGTTYYYVVTVSNGSCDSDPSTQASAKPLLCPQGAPGNVAATPSGSVQVKITWTAASPVPTKYNVTRSTSSGGTYTSIYTSADGTTLTYTDNDTSLTPNATYYYKVTAIGSTCSTTSAAVSATTACSAPTAPSPSITANPNGSIYVSWATASGATAYTISRSDDNGASYTAKITQTALNYTDGPTGLNNGTVYYYKVTATNANGQCSAQSGAVSTRSCIIVAAPTNLLARRSGNKQVTVAWTNSPNGSVYKVWRSGTNVATVSGSPGVDDNATNTTAFSYVVTAASHASCPASDNSLQASVPSCTVKTGSGAGTAQLQGQTSEWCLVTCDNNITWWTDSGLGDRTLLINTFQQTGEGTHSTLPAQVNSGYAFYFTAGSGNYPYWGYGGGAGRSCP